MVFEWWILLALLPTPHRTYFMSYMKTILWIAHGSKLKDLKNIDIQQKLRYSYEKSLYVVLMHRTIYFYSVCFFIPAAKIQNNLPYFIHISRLVPSFWYVIVHTDHIPNSFSLFTLLHNLYRMTILSNFCAIHKWFNITCHMNKRNAHVTCKTNMILTSSYVHLHSIPKLQVSG